MITVLVMFIVMCGFVSLATYESVMLNLLAILSFCLASWFLYHYLRAILNREIIIAPSGVYYREASRRLFFAWEKIQRVKLEPEFKQITFWQDNKLQRIHEFGLPKQELMLVRRALLQQLESRNIQLVIGKKVIGGKP